MSSKSHKKQLWERYVTAYTKHNSTRLLALWWSIHITKPAFLKKQDLEIQRAVEKILKERGVKLGEPREYRKRT